MSVTFQIDLNPLEISNDNETVPCCMGLEKIETVDVKNKNESVYELEKAFSEKSSFTNSTLQSKNSNDQSSTLFTFKPKMNAKSNLIAQKLLSFAERQDQHTQKQIKLVYTFN